MTKALVNGKTRYVIVQMHSLQLNLGSLKVLQRFFRLKICIYKPYKDVRKFCNINVFCSPHILKSLSYVDFVIQFVI